MATHFKFILKVFSVDGKTATPQWGKGGSAYIFGMYKCQVITLLWLISQPSQMQLSSKLPIESCSKYQSWLMKLETAASRLSSASATIPQSVSGSPSGSLASSCSSCSGAFALPEVTTRRGWNHRLFVPSQKSLLMSTFALCGAILARLLCLEQEHLGFFTEAVLKANQK